MAADRFSGAVLAGGQSRRMGTDKALLMIDGSPLVVRGARALRAAGADEVFIVGGDVTAIASLGLAAVADRWPGEGPLGGILTALGHAACDHVVVLACDHVDPRPRALREIAGALPGSDVAVPMVDGRPQYLHAAWSRSAYAPLLSAFEGGVRAVHEAVVALTAATVALRDPNSTRDLDTPASVLRWHAEPTETATISGVEGDDVTVPQRSVDDLEAALSNGAFLVDVREDDEVAEVRVDGGLHIALGAVVDRLDEVPRDQPVYVICAAGGRSQTAAEFYCAQGIDAHNVIGGTNTWVLAGKPVATGPMPS